MPQRKHKDWILDYVAKVAPNSEAPERYIYWSAVAAVGGALRRRVCFNEGSYTWFPNWFLVLVGPPGLVHKTTTIDLAMNILREVEGVNFGPSISTWEGFITFLANAKDIYATGGNGKGFVDQEYEVSSALTLSVGEWGTFFDPNNYTMVNVLTDLWDCRNTPMVKVTKTQGNDTIVAPFLNMIAGTTPDWMNQNFRGQYGGWGLSSRCIFLHCAKAERAIAYPSQMWGAERDTWHVSFLHDLRQIAALEGEYTLSSEARAHGTMWYEAHVARIETFSQHPNRDPWVGYYLARKQAHIHKLALCLAAGRRDELVITLSDLLEAIDRCDQVEDEIGAIFGSRHRASRQVALNMDVWRGLADALAKHTQIKERDYFKYTTSWMVNREAKDLLEQLIRAGYLERHAEGLNVWLRLGGQAMPGQGSEGSE